MNPNLFYLNGLDGTTGKYLAPPLAPEVIRSIARSEVGDDSLLRELKAKKQEKTFLPLGPIQGVDGKDISQAGWGIIFAGQTPERVVDALKEALSELIEHRRSQVGDLYKECKGPLGFWPGDTKETFLKRFEAKRGRVNPKLIPYYLLIVGDPSSIPFEFQYEMDVQHAVGRIHFQELEDYAHYARSVVNAEKKQLAKRKLTLFGVQNQDDRATELSSSILIPGLESGAKDYIARGNTTERQHLQGWEVDIVTGEKANVAGLSSLVNDGTAPGLLLTASHGMGFPAADFRQISHQGALLCDEWKGPVAHRGEIPADFYFSEDNVEANANLGGSILFHFACYGGGTPRHDDYAKVLGVPPIIAPHPFVARLPQKLLSRPRGGALAVVAHVERAWGYSFLSNDGDAQLATFQSTLHSLLDGEPVGFAMEHFNSAYAELSTDLTNIYRMLDRQEMEDDVRDLELPMLWTANQDARSFVVFGDPAVRVNASSSVVRPEMAPLKPVTLKQEDIAAYAVFNPPPGSSFESGSNPVPGSGGVEFGLLSDTGRSLMQGLESLTQKLSQTLTNLTQDLSELNVETFTTADFEVDGTDCKGLPSNAKKRAFTRTGADGDTQVCLPEIDGKVDDSLWAIHLDSVRLAQTHRIELLQMVAKAAAGMLQILRPS